MIIQLPEWDGWRIEGADLDWQIQKAVHRKSGDTWEGTNFYPFVGSGTTCIACAELGIPFEGYDIDATYCEIARERLEVIA